MLLFQKWEGPCVPASQYIYIYIYIYIVSMCRFIGDSISKLSRGAGARYGACRRGWSTAIKSSPRGAKYALRCLLLYIYCYFRRHSILSFQYIYIYIYSHVQTKIKYRAGQWWFSFLNSVPRLLHTLVYHDVSTFLKSKVLFHYKM